MFPNINLPLTVYKDARINLNTYLVIKWITQLITYLIKH
jgi:hypothetical protein